MYVFTVFTVFMYVCMYELILLPFSCDFNNKMMNVVVLSSVPKYVVYMYIYMYMCICLHVKDNTVSIRS